MSIANILGHGKDKALTRAQLVAMTGQSDRKVRKEIEEARDQGVLIICDQDGAGYYISEDPKDLRRQLMTNQARATSIMKKQKFLRRKLAEVEMEAMYENHL